MLANQQETDANVTQMLVAWRAGQKDAEARLLELVYDELRRLARRFRRSERADHTLNSTALVHEAYIKLVAGKNCEFQDRAHFFAIASRVMRQILVDSARARLAARRGNGPQKVAIDGLAIAAPAENPEQMLALDQALTRLEGFAPRQARIVEMRYFGGMTEEEMAAQLDLTTRTIRNDWTVAKSWLYGELKSA